MPRPLHEQTVVITGASSGIGRETARQLASQGARVVLAARNDAALHAAAEEMDASPERGLVIPTDVAEWPQVERLAAQTIERFGRIDTWVNNASVFYAGPVEKMSIEEIDRVMQVNFMGTVHGVKAALPHLIRQGDGHIINVTSVDAARAMPLQAAYSASKHAAKGFTEALRLELARDHPGIHVTEVLPASINTPLFAHARSGLEVKPRPIPPVYEPAAVAEAIVFAAEHPRRDIYVGPGRGLAAIEGIAPGLVDWLISQNDLIFKVQRSNRPDDGQDNLFAPMPTETYAVTGEWSNEAMASSLVTRQLELHPERRYAALGLVALATLALVRRSGR